MYDGRNTLSINAVVVDEEEEAKDDEMQPQSVPVQKMPLGRLIYILRDKN